MNVNSARILSSAGFHSYCRSSSDTNTLGAAFRRNHDGMHLRIQSSEMSRRMMATGMDINPSTTE